jgi:hypothetical protein
LDNIVRIEGYDNRVIEQKVIMVIAVNYTT